jgi:hypothetical protein
MMGSPRIQILTVEDLLNGARIYVPPAGRQFKVAPRKPPDHEQTVLL